jgi:hypothetical protein
MEPSSEDQVAALNDGIGRASAVKREARAEERMKRIEKKLDEILARMGNNVSQTKVK